MGVGGERVPSFVFRCALPACMQWLAWLASNSLALMGHADWNFLGDPGLKNVLNYTYKNTLIQVKPNYSSMTTW